MTLFPGEGPFIVNDHSSREASQLVASLGFSAAGVWNHKSFPLYGHTLWVIGPEHAAAIGRKAGARWTSSAVSSIWFDARPASWYPAPTVPRAGA